MIFQESEIIINGKNVGPACAMTIRVAIEVFASDLIENGLGDEDQGKAMVKSYLSIIDDIRLAMGLI